MNGVLVTDHELLEHRLQVLEKLAAGAHDTERRVDHLSLDVAAIKVTVTRTEAAMEAEARRAHESNRRIHERLDEWEKQEAEDAGARKARLQIAKLTVAVLGSVGVVAAIVFGVLQATGAGG